MFAYTDYKIPNGQPVYTVTTPHSNESTKFTVEEVLKAYNALGFPDVNQSTIDKITHYLLDEGDEYSEYIRLKEKFEGVKAAEPEPNVFSHEPTGYRYSDGTPILYGDEIEYELPRKFLRAPYSLPPTRMCGEVIKVFADCGIAYDFHVTDGESYSGNSPTLKSIVETSSHIKKVV